MTTEGSVHSTVERATRSQGTVIAQRAERIDTVSHLRQSLIDFQFFLFEYLERAIPSRREGTRAGDESSAVEILESGGRNRWNHLVTGMNQITEQRYRPQIAKSSFGFARVSHARLGW